MLTLMIRRRVTKAGSSFHVRYRLGGRSYPLLHGGAFRTLREARVRRDLIGGEIAAGRNPQALLATLRDTEREEVITFATWGERFLASRIDVDANTVRGYGSSIRKIGKTFGPRDVKSITATEIAEWIAEQAQERKPGTIGQYLIAFRLVLDHAGREPNPARDPRVKLPKQIREEVTPPSAEHVEAILEALAEKWRLLFTAIEQGALRLGEAVNLSWGDVDGVGLRLRLPRSATKRDKSRWVYLPAWLMKAIEDTCPLEDRTPERKVFQGVTEASAYQAMLRACRNAKVPHYHPHDLRHRRITIWHQSGVVARELAERAGHARPSMSLDVYSHVMPATELPDERFSALLTPSS
jgi:integrase